MASGPLELVREPHWRDGIAMWASSIALSISQCEFEHGRNKRRAIESLRFDNFASKSLLQETLLLEGDVAGATAQVASEEPKEESADHAPKVSS